MGDYKCLEHIEKISLRDMSESLGGAILGDKNVLLPRFCLLMDFITIVNKRAEEGKSFLRAVMLVHHRLFGNLDGQDGIAGIITNFVDFILGIKFSKCPRLALLNFITALNENYTPIEPSVDTAPGSPMAPNALLTGVAMDDMLLGMKNRMLVAMLMVAMIFGMSACTENQAAKNFGGKMTIHIPKNEKVVNVTFKEDDMWILTRPRKDGEVGETLHFTEKSSFGVLQGDVTFVEDN